MLVPRLFRQIASVLLVAPLLVSCSGVAARPYSMGDTDPHDGVARAHQMPVQGIDVSQWQGDVNWHAAKAAGIQFAFIKATEGGDYVDPKFQQNWRGAKAAGIPRGAYHFVYWCRPANQQALWFMLNVPQDPDALPPVLDVEWNSSSRTCPHKISRADALAKIKILLDAMQAHTGMKPIIYTDPMFYREVLQGQFQSYPFWLRSVAAEPHKLYPGRPFAFWQFTTTGRVPGVQGDVDRNIFNGSRAAWERSIGLTEAASR